MNCTYVKINSLDNIQRQVLDLFPDTNSARTVLFYIDNNKAEFLKITELRQELQRLDLLDHVSSIGFYNIMTTSSLGTTIHVDHGESVYSFNLPIKGYANTFVNFYSTNGAPEKRLNNAGVPFYYIDPAGCSLTERYETAPCIINVKKPHNVTNTNSENRITLLIRLSGEWDYDKWLISRQSKDHV